MAGSGPVLAIMACLAGAWRRNGSISQPPAVNVTSAAPMVNEGCGIGISTRISENQSTLRKCRLRSVGVCARRHLLAGTVK